MRPYQDERFWYALDELVRARKVVIDRPRGTPHPRFPGHVYPLDYGYVEGTRTTDGGGVDVWVGSRGVEAPCGVLTTVDGRKGDVEIKLLLGCTEEEIDSILAFLRGLNLPSLLLMRAGA